MKRSKKIAVATVLVVLVAAGVSAVYFLKQDQAKPATSKQGSTAKKYQPGDKLPDPPKIETKSSVTTSKEPAKPENVYTGPTPRQVKTPE